MICPACDKPILTLEFDEVEIDYCPECKGVWLDAGELELLARGSGDQSSLRIKLGRKGRRRCPRCRARMQAGKYPGTGIEVDACPREHGFWFDEGELKSALRARGAKGTAGKLVEYFGNVFGS